MKEIVLIVPYFGVLPEWMPLFYSSCEHLKSKIDIMLFTDDESFSTLKLPSNIIVHNVSYEWFENLLEEKKLRRTYYPYKICDYKPLFGYIFESYIKDYQYWGYCDIDLLFGDVISFLEKYEYWRYDRVGVKGHFTIYKNNGFCRNLFLYKSSRIPSFFTANYMMRTTLPCNFDECGMNLICKANKMKFLEKDFALQNSLLRELHLHTSHSKYPELFLYSNGKIFRLFKQNNKIEKQEYMYMHFIDRKTMPVMNGCNNEFLITHLGFVPFDENKINDYFSKYGRFDTSEEMKEYRALCAVRNKKKKKEKIFREFRINGIRAFYNFYIRLLAILYLKRNKMF